MGLSASQARLLSLTARMADTEFASQQICNAKTSLAKDSDRVSQEYTDALNKTHLKIASYSEMGERNMVALTYNNLMNSNLGHGTYRLMSSDNKMVMSVDMQTAIQNVGETQTRLSETLDSATNNYSKALEEAGMTDEQLTIALLVADLVKNGIERVIGNKKTVILDKLVTHVKNLIEDKNSLSERVNFINSREGSKLIDAASNELFENVTARDVTNFFRAYSSTDGKNPMPGASAKVDYQNLIELRTAKINAEDEYNSWSQMSDSEHVAEEYKNLTGIESDSYLDWYNSGQSFATIDAEQANSADWLKAQLENGNYYIEQLTGTGSNQKWDAISIATGTELKEEGATDLEMAKAEAKYNQEMNKITAKDKKFDLKLKQLETEHNATKTEYDSVKKVIDENIQRSFKTFS